MTNSIAVVTACTNGRDNLSEDHVLDGADFIAYVDQLEPSSVWEQKQAHSNFHSARRNSRIHKILIHQYVDTEYSIWMDANVRLLVPAERVVKEWLKNHDIGIFRHRIRDCLYDEAELCAALHLDKPEIIREQVELYRKQNYPRGQGLAEACVIVRRHTAAVENFNNAWWAEYCRHSVRDQISLMVAARKASVPLNLVTPGRFDHPFFHSTPRPPGMEYSVKLPANVLEIC
jgi:hypothetical protein